jgi:hypothetical protein
MILLGARHCSGTAATPPVSYFFFATGSWTAKEKRARLTGGGALEKKALKEGMTHALRFSVFLLWIGWFIRLFCLYGLLPFIFFDPEDTRCSRAFATQLCQSRTLLGNRRWSGSLITC